MPWIPACAGRMADTGCGLSIMSWDNHETIINGLKIILRPFEGGSHRPLTGCARGSLPRSRRTDLNARKRAGSDRRWHDDETFNHLFGRLKKIVPLWQNRT